METRNKRGVNDFSAGRLMITVILLCTVYTSLYDLGKPLSNFDNQENLW